MPSFQMIPLKQLHESPTNPRRVFGDLTEMAASVREKGIYEPLLARPKPNGKAPSFEIVFGHRRYRAAKLAELEDAPVMVRDMSDKEVLEAQLVENCQREDLHPLEEAEGYRRLHEEHGYTIDDLAVKVGKSKGYVYGRLKLCALSPKSREAFFKGTLTPSVALLVARIPVAKLQEEALKDLTDGYRGTMSARDAAEHIQRRFMLRLADAPFKTADAALVAEAGACSTCPKRTGNQPELFSDIKSADVCTDPVCFGKKREAGWSQQAAEAEAKGLVVLTDKEAKKVFPYRHASSESNLVDLTDEVWNDPKHRKWGALIGKDHGLRVTLARDQDGGVHKLVDRREALKAAKDHGHLKDTRQASTSSSGAREKKEREKDLVHRDAVKSALTALVAQAEKKEPTEAWWRFLAEHVVREFWRDVAVHVCKRRGIDLKKGDEPGAVLRKMAQSAPLPAVRGLLIEMICSRDAYAGRYAGDRSKVLGEACQLYRIDWATHQTEAAAARRAKKASRKAGAK